MPIAGCQQTISNKRKRDITDESVTPSNSAEPGNPESQQEARKCTVKEGFSWWTCMMYDMPLEKTKPQAIHKGQGHS